MAFKFYVNEHHGRHDPVRKERLDAKELAARNILREKENIRAKKLRQESLKVSTDIALPFKNLQHHFTIWLQYNFE